MDHPRSIHADGRLLRSAPWRGLGVTVRQEAAEAAYPGL